MLFRSRKRLSGDGVDINDQNCRDAGSLPPMLPARELAVIVILRRACANTVKVLFIRQNLEKIKYGRPKPPVIHT